MGFSYRYDFQIVQLRRYQLKTRNKMNGSDNQIMAVSALDIAGVFLEMSKEIGLTNLKLNKLVYLAHGYYWGNFETPLITNGELPEAWKHGPVYRSVYNTFGSFKSDVIPSAYAALPTNVKSNGEMFDFLDQFWEIFKDAPPPVASCRDVTRKR